MNSCDFRFFGVFFLVKLDFFYFFFPIDFSNSYLKNIKKKKKVFWRSMLKSKGSVPSFLRYKTRLSEIILPK